MIEKYSSPTGDGNYSDSFMFFDLLLRNIVPRQGTETKSRYGNKLEIEH